MPVKATKFVITKSDLAKLDDASARLFLWLATSRTKSLHFSAFSLTLYSRPSISLSTK